MPTTNGETKETTEPSKPVENPEDEEVETVTVYKCKYCGAIFSDKDSAISCQKGHKKVISIEDTYYPKITEDESNYPYPNRLMIKFNDGTERPYVKAR